MATAAVAVPARACADARPPPPHLVVPPRWSESSSGLAAIQGSMQRALCPQTQPQTDAFIVY